MANFGMLCINNSIFNILIEKKNFDKSDCIEVEPAVI